jgi:hypothetical protein
MQRLGDKFHKNDAYRIIQFMDVGLNVFVNIIAYEGECDWDKAVKLANDKLTAILKDNCIEIHYMGICQIIENESRGKYKFEVYTRNLPKPTNVFVLTEIEKGVLISDKRYIIVSDDCIGIDWNISDVYRKMKSAYPDKNEFYLSSLAYRIEKI